MKLLDGVERGTKPGQNLLCALENVLSGFIAVAGQIGVSVDFHFDVSCAGCDDGLDEADLLHGSDVDPGGDDAKPALSVRKFLQQKGVMLGRITQGFECWYPFGKIGSRWHIEDHLACAMSGKKVRKDESRAARRCGSQRIHVSKDEKGVFRARDRHVEHAG